MANEPQKWASLLGSGADVNTIPEETPTGTGAASMKSIFPSITQVPLTAGGIAPDRADFNGLFKLLGDNIYYQQQGGVYSYSATIDYAKGSQVKHNDKIYVAIQANGPATIEKEPGEDPDFWQEVVLSNTGIIATGTTNARDLENRFADVVNAKDFGAVGDGVTDDTVAMNAFFNYLADNGGVGYVPKGTYLTGTINLRKQTFKDGVLTSNNFRWNKPFSVYGVKGGTIIKTLPNNYSTFDFRGCKLFTLSDFSIDNGKQTTTITELYGGSGIYLVDCSDFTISNLYIYNFRQCGIISYLSGLQTSISSSNNLISNVVVNGYGNFFPDFGDGVYVNDSRYWCSGMILVSFHDSVVENCIVKYCSGYGLEYKGYGAYPNGATERSSITNCSVIQCFHGGIYLGGEEGSSTPLPYFHDDVVIDSCMVEDCAYPYFFGKCNNVSVSNSINKSTSSYPWVHSSVNKGYPFGVQHSHGFVLKNFINADSKGAQTIANVKNCQYCSFEISFASLYDKTATLAPWYFDTDTTNCDFTISASDNTTVRYNFDDVARASEQNNVYIDNIGKLKTSPRKKIEYTDIDGYSETWNSTANGTVIKAKGVLSQVLLSDSDSASGGMYFAKNKTHHTNIIGYGNSGEIRIGYYNADLEQSNGYISFKPNIVNPNTDGVVALGTASYKWSQVYASNGSINTSDERLKTEITDPNDALMKAWGKVNFKVFKFKDAIEKKGDDARKHIGVIAQEVQKAFESEGLNASDYGLFCYDEWEDKYEKDEEGNGVLVQKAGNAYAIRYTEALALECAYQRWLGYKREERIKALEAKLK